MEEIELPLPAIIKPVKLWTGKQLVSLLVRPNKDVKLNVNTELCEKSYKTNGPLCNDEGYIVFRNSDLVCGSIAKKTLGVGSKLGLLYTLMQVAGPKEALRCACIIWQTELLSFVLSAHHLIWFFSSFFKMHESPS